MENRKNHADLLQALTEILASHREGSGRMIPKKSKDGKPKDMEAEIRGYP